MLDQAVLDLAGADAVARRLEHIVAAALVPEVAVGIAQGLVAGAAPVAGVLGLGGGLVLPVAQEEDGVGVAMQRRSGSRHVAGYATGHSWPFVVDDATTGGRVAHAHAAGLGQWGVKALQLPTM